MKIVYCIDSVYLLGGMEKVTIVKANALAKIPSNEVWVVVTDACDNSLIPLEGVHLVNLDVNYYDWGVGYLGFCKKHQLHKKRLTECLNRIMPDVVVATGKGEKYLVPYLKLVSKPVIIREMHIAKYYRRMSVCGLKEKLFAWAGEIYEYHWNMKRYDHIVLLTEEDRERNWKGWKNISVIPNPITSVCEEKSTCTVRTAIAVGRLADQKDFAALIRIWRRVTERHPDWRLEIWGTGELRMALQQQIKALDLENKVFLMGFTSEPLIKMSQASIYLLSSKCEGLPLVMIEAMSVGLPVVSYMCPTGPKDIIDDGKTGFLVPLGDEDTFVDRVCMLIEDERLRKDMGQAAQRGVEQYRIEKIIQRWMALFQELLAKEKHNAY